MTTAQLSKLNHRISTLKAQNRIVWIEGIEKEIIKGKLLGKPVYFVRAESLNADGGSWYYIVSWQAVRWSCTCESVKPCKHEIHVNNMLVAQYRARKMRESITGEDLVPHVEDDLRFNAWHGSNYGAERPIDERGTLNGQRGFVLMR